MPIDAHVPKRSRLLEFSVACVLVGIAALFLLPALWRIEAEAERTAVETTIRNINTGLRLAEAELITQGREAERRQLLLANPVGWLVGPPADYAERDHVDVERIAAGQWVWERETRLLHYRPRHAESLRIEGGNTLAWHIVAAGNGASLRPGALRIESVRPYDWHH